VPKAYVVANIDVHDPEMNARCRELARPTVEAHGGRYIIRGPKLEKLEGDFELNRLVVLEFPSVDAARGWFNSPEYREVVKLRHGSAVSHLVLAEGFDG
jgi:uncharacterized protein (DUF1330 family)